MRNVYNNIYNILRHVTEENKIIENTKDNPEESKIDKKLKRNNVVLDKFNLNFNFSDDILFIITEYIDIITNVKIMNYISKQWNYIIQNPQYENYYSKKLLNQRKNIISYLLMNYVYNYQYMSDSTIVQNISNIVIKYLEYFKPCIMNQYHYTSCKFSSHLLDDFFYNLFSGQWDTLNLNYMIWKLFLNQPVLNFIINVLRKDFFIN